MKRKIIIFLTVCSLVASLLCSCETEQVTVSTHQFFAFDTIVSVMYYGEYDEEIMSDIDAMLVRYEMIFSATNAESELYKLNEDGYITDNAELFSLLKKSLEISASTGGAFDVTVLPLMNAWGFLNKNYSVPTDNDLESLLQSVGYGKVALRDGNGASLSDGAKVDLGGIAKGYVSDKIVEYLKGRGVSGGIVSVGGSSAVFGSKPDKTAYNIGIVDPTDPSKIAGAVSVRDKSVLTSGTYQRYFENDGKTYHHILDPKTGKPVDNGLLSVTVISDSGMHSDALSTALFVMGLETAMQYYETHGGFEAVFLTNDNKFYITDGLKDTIEINLDGSFILQFISEE